uniref:Coiled-coil domain-containing protein 167 n=1 Tax=Amblyomma triste TaxID=251400 RepID=A0A023G691_AMBTT
MPDNPRVSVMKEIDRNEALVQEYLFQLDQIESKLRRYTLSDSQRKKLEDEVKSLKSQLDTLEKELTGLRKENRKILVHTSTKENYDTGEGHVQNENVLATLLR